jgi:uncharacterized integral membrane protein
MVDEPAAAPKPERKEQARLIGAVILVGLIAALAIDNSHEVKIGYVLGDARVRLIWLLLITAILGAGVGWLAGRRRHRG